MWVYYPVLPHLLPVNWIRNFYRCSKFRYFVAFFEDHSLNVFSDSRKTRICDKIWTRSMKWSMFKFDAFSTHFLNFEYNFFQFFWHEIQFPDFKYNFFISKCNLTVLVVILSFLFMFNSSTLTDKVKKHSNIINVSHKNDIRFN